MLFIPTVSAPVFRSFFVIWIRHYIQLITWAGSSRQEIAERLLMNPESECWDWGRGALLDFRCRRNHPKGVWETIPPLISNSGLIKDRYVRGVSPDIDFKCLRLIKRRTLGRHCICIIALVELRGGTNLNFLWESHPSQAVTNLLHYADISEGEGWVAAWWRKLYYSLTFLL